ncbi:hypothetical protein GCM10010387_23120 [Streptomyces inusitatus]|uniref:Uncharacterized protein n=1 Tax=Streptomyces inusitatus TaxID=68221 RepID=A0A918Q096_9ACTN|nr:hypothetical protein [Streptomyces inusitatus]GGZ29175.1 hypothetical protein GCM10010387_23120 [Streptomyces inusitatus]
MSHTDSAPSAEYGAAVESLAGRVLLAVSGGEESPDLAAHLRKALDTKAALAAVRVLGPDVFAPALLASVPSSPTDREVVAEALRVFPSAPGDPPEVAWLDRATLALLARPDNGTIGTIGTVVAVDSAADGASESSSESASGGAEPAPEERHWRPWAQGMARLSPLALPGVRGEAAEQASRRVLDLYRGLTRSMLRRDYPTTARLARWGALAEGAGTAALPGMDIETVVRHLELCGAVGARTVLDTTIAGRIVAARQNPKERSA